MKTTRWLSVNKDYLKSLAGYLAFNAMFWVALVLLTVSQPTMTSFLTTMFIAVIFHKIFVWKKV